MIRTICDVWLISLRVTTCAQEGHFLRAARAETRRAEIAEKHLVRRLCVRGEGPREQVQGRDVQVPDLRCTL